jgi:cytochrome c553
MSNLLFFLLAGALSAPALAALQEGDAAAGKRISKTELCQECHGEDGNSLSMSTPKLAGHPAAYIVKQLGDFQSGARKHVVMNEMAASLSAADRFDIAAWFASRKRMPEPDRLVNLRGRDLFLYGDMERDIPQCANCHGERGQGAVVRGVNYPALAAQHRTYLRIQLINWRLGERRNSPDGVMNRIAQALSDDDIDALAEYLSGL